MQPQRARDRNGADYEYRPECAEAGTGVRVTFDGRTGVHEGAGWVRIYGGGERYGYVRA